MGEHPGSHFMTQSIVGHELPLAFGCTVAVLFQYNTVHRIIGVPYRRATRKLLLRQSAQTVIHVAVGIQKLLVDWFRQGVLCCVSIAFKS